MGIVVILVGRYRHAVWLPHYLDHAGTVMALGISNPGCHTICKVRWWCGRRDSSVSNGLVSSADGAVAGKSNNYWVKEELGAAPPASSSNSQHSISYSSSSSSASMSYICVFLPPQCPYSSFSVILLVSRIVDRYPPQGPLCHPPPGLPQDQTPEHNQVTVQWVRHPQHTAGPQQRSHHQHALHPGYTNLGRVHALAPPGQAHNRERVGPEERPLSMGPLACTVAQVTRAHRL
ncbi:hypothetical protein Tco_0975131 [Tanacetum coccineum]|uniref:Uncharacterized protein n=1 Tax=Tanacetum coccineum TaxID=301880 RepID=A0ABQ5EDJ0_9ASTR